MVRLALATVRARVVSFAGVFVALALGVGVIAMMILALWSVGTSVSSGAQRYADAPVVVTKPVVYQLTDADDGDVRKFPIVRPGNLPEQTVTALAKTGRTVEDRSFSARVEDGPGDQVGHAWSSAAFTPYRLAAGHAPRAADEIVVGGGEPSLVGRTVGVTVAGEVGHYKVVGVTDLVWFEDAVFFTDAQAKKLSPGVQAVVAYGKADRIRAAAPGTSVLTGDDRLFAEVQQEGGREQLLDAEGMAGTSLLIVAFVAVFVVVATFAFVVDQRRRELALFRSIGATPGQVRRMVIMEALLLAAFASAVGCAIGSQGTGPLRDFMIDKGIAPAWFQIDFVWPPLIIAFAVGLVSALVGTAAVSWKAGRVKPAEALREATGKRRVLAPVRIVLGLVVLGLGLQKGLSAMDSPLTAMSMQSFFPVPVLIVGGCALLTPLLLRPVLFLASWPLSKLGAGAMIVREGVLFASRRTSSVAAPVVLAIGLGGALLTAPLAAGAAGDADLRAQTKADYTVVAEDGTSISPAAAQKVREVPGTESAVLTFGELRLSDAQKRYIGTLSTWAVDPKALQATHALKVVSGSMNGFGKQQLVLDKETADEFGIATGDKVRAGLPDGTTVNLTVAALTGHSVLGETGYVSADHAAGGDPTRIDVKVTGGGDAAAVAAALRKAVAGQPAEVSPMGEYLDRMRAQKQDQAQLATRIVFGLAMGYALLSIANTLVMAAPGRRRELAALNLTGATRGDALKFVAAETAVAALAGAILGGIAATLVVLAQRVALTELADNFAFSVPWASVIGIAAACGAVAVTVAVFATRFFLRGRLLDLIGKGE
ncbi:ABC transporter permease [Streptomyces sp. VRA16 Mangrove soil]|uniref:ABC transporter permease n=1 Tax=Streptomyces sp. VRA16 Mangrove soil TaxID=2817434 RepID=UPI001A9F35F4|nr:ABC transporter permease [Streptomyces sp. VRA16 Mangrove soil]MBO1334084.1 ABC transporter permease [Streptomyces sp. VRA16 Mangrove soil]